MFPLMLNHKPDFHVFSATLAFAKISCIICHTAEFVPKSAGQAGITAWQMFWKGCYPV